MQARVPDVVAADDVDEAVASPVALRHDGDGAAQVEVVGDAVLLSVAMSDRRMWTPMKSSGLSDPPR